MMLQSLPNIIRKFRADQRGVTLVEYGIAISLAVTLGVAAFSLLAGEISTALTTVGTQMPN